MSLKLHTVFIWSLPVLSGLLLSLSFFLFNQTYLVWLALVPLFIFLNKITSTKQAGWGSFITGFLFFGISLRWIFEAWPLNWVGVATNQTSTFIIVTLVWLASVIILGLLVGIFGLLIYKIGFDFKKGLVVAVLWLLLEYIRSWIFILPWLGPETNFGPHWSFVNLAYALHNQNHFLKLAPSCTSCLFNSGETIPEQINPPSCIPCTSIKPEL